jgi:hypothetical protein
MNIIDVLRQLILKFDRIFNFEGLRLVVRNYFFGFLF